MNGTDNMERRTKGTGRIWFDERQGVWKGRIRIGGKDIYRTLNANRRESEAAWKKFVEEARPRIKQAALSDKLELGLVWAKVKDTIAASNGGIDETKYIPIWNDLTAFLETRGRQFLEDVTSTDIAAFAKERFAKLSPCSYNNYVVYLSRIFNFALPKGAENPVLCLGKKAVVQESREPLNDDEIASLLETAKAKGAEWHRLVTVGLNTGLRLKDCVYLSSDKIQNGMISLVPYKTAKKSGRRVNIPLNAALHEVLDGIEGRFCPELVKDYEHDASNFTRRLTCLFTHAGIQCSKVVEGRLRRASTKGFHSLRATFITRLSMAGVSLGIIQSMAGHTGDAQTLAYCHPHQAALQTAVDSLPTFDGKAKKYVSEEAKTIADTTAGKVIDALRRMGIAADDDSDFHARLAPIEAKLEKVEGMSAVEKNAACIGAAFALAEMMGIPSTLSA